MLQQLPVFSCPFIIIPSFDTIFYCVSLHCSFASETVMRYHLYSQHWSGHGQTVAMRAHSRTTSFTADYTCRPTRHKCACGISSAGLQKGEVVTGVYMRSLKFISTFRWSCVASRTDGVYGMWWLQNSSGTDIDQHTLCICNTCRL